MVHRAWPGKRAWQNKEVNISRGVAIIVSLLMIQYFFTSDAVRSDNMFLVPDLLLAFFLLVSGLLPTRIAKPALIYAFGWTGGVLTTSMFGYVVRGEFPQDGGNHLFLIIPCAAMAVALARNLQKRDRAAGELVRAEGSDNHPGVNRESPARVGP